MNIAFFLTPKSDVICENINSTMRQAMERMEFHSYTAIPIIDDNGKYVGTLTEGDLLWKLKNTPDLNFLNSSKIKLTDINRRTLNKAVSINSDIESLLSLAVNQNFVPVVDDEGVFIGIIKRSDIINYCYKKIAQKSALK
ncbi:CBS domain-containing protein [Clostridium sp. 19966]|uniref:CBS domain-containing protein n=1 Tax=Clostridium sp. 19966 TaxID=2768166 RepID=UPI0028DEB841|nr:CBS domain-containing protein [Clostridium sp. 19966]MDT8716321.1 CBS domain-containing protein [Clostridium sp. 19966]